MNSTQGAGQGPGQEKKRNDMLTFGLVAVLCAVAIAAVVMLMNKPKDKDKADTKQTQSAADQQAPKLGKVLQADDEAETPEQEKAEPERKPIDWGYEQYQKAIKATGRNMEMSEAAFDAVQTRRERALKRIEQYLIGKFGEADPLVMKAFEELPREYFHYHYQHRQSLANAAYEDKAKPYPIGFGSALSDYLGQAYMTQMAEPKPDDVVLEIGTGSGYQISLLSRIVKEAYSIEIIEPLGEAVSKIFEPLGLDNVKTRVGDGYFGWPEVEGGFDIIIVTCTARFVSPELIKQLKPGTGRMLIPIGTPFKRDHFLYIYTKDKDGKIRSRKDVGMYFVPMTGAIEKEKKPNL